jgi:DnaJ-class molecular chaperone
MCEGARVVSSTNGKSWNQFAGKPYFSKEMTEIREGKTEPKTCPQCNGAGVIDKAANKKA